MPFKSQPKHPKHVSEQLRAVLDLIQPVLTLQSRILDNGIQVTHDSLMSLGCRHLTIAGSEGCEVLKFLDSQDGTKHAHQREPQQAGAGGLCQELWLNKLKLSGSGWGFSRYRATSSWFQQVSVRRKTDVKPSSPCSRDRVFWYTRFVSSPITCLLPQLSECCASNRCRLAIL